MAAPALGDSALEVTLVVPDAVAKPGGDAASRSLGRGRWSSGPARWRRCSSRGGAGGAVRPGGVTWLPWRSRRRPRPWVWQCATADGVEAEFALTGRRRHVETLTPALEHLLGTGRSGPRRPRRRRRGHRSRAVHRAPGRGRRGQGTGAGARHRGGLRHEPRRPDRRRGRGGPTERSRAGLRRRPAWRGVRRAARAGPEKARRWRNHSRRHSGRRASWPPRSAGWRGRRCRGGRRGAAIPARSCRRHQGFDVVAPALSFPPPSTLLRLALARLERGEAPVERRVGRSSVHA